MIDVRDIWRFDIIVGNSLHPRDGACVLDAVSWLMYGALGDHPDCVCPVIAEYVRLINDCLPHPDRQRLRAYIPRLIGTVDRHAESQRQDFLNLEIYRVYLPSVLRAVNEIELAVAYAAAAEAGDWLQIIRLNDGVYLIIMEQARRVRQQANARWTKARMRNLLLPELAAYPPLHAYGSLGTAEADQRCFAREHTNMAATYITDAAARFRCGSMPPEMVAALFVTLDRLLAIGKQADRFLSHDDARDAMRQFELAATLKKEIT